MEGNKDLMLRKHLVTTAFAAILFVTMSGMAYANPIVTYQITPGQISTPTSNVTFSRTGLFADVLRGINISIDSLLGQGMGPSILRNCIGCTLEFTSGVGVTYAGAVGSPFNSETWTFASGGTAVIKGGVDLNSNGILDAGDITAGSTLLSGFFLNSPTVSRSSADHVLGAGLILNSQNQQLNQYMFGQPLGGPIWTGSLSIRFNPGQYTAWTGGIPSFSSTVIVNGSLVNEVPEPNSGLILLLSTGLLGIGLGLRRRANHNS